MELNTRHRFDRAATALATGLYLSYIPEKLQRLFGLKVFHKWTGAGFIGTVEGLLLTPLLPKQPSIFSGFLAAAAFLSCWLCGRAEITLGRHDDPHIVLDEIVGFWTAIAFLPRTTGVYLAGFILFRFFDSVKLPPYSWLERLPGGFGVVGDDIGAALLANLLVRGLMNLRPAFFA